MSISAVEVTSARTSSGVKVGQRATAKTISKPVELITRPNDAVSLGALTADGDDASKGDKLKGPAHGVVRLLSAGHFKGAAETKLMAKFGHLIKTDDDEPTEENDDVSVLTPVSAGGDDSNFVPPPPVLPDTELNPWIPAETMANGLIARGIDLIA